jgi:hypothetical protein
MGGPANDKISRFLGSDRDSDLPLVLRQFSGFLLGRRYGRTTLAACLKSTIRYGHWQARVGRGCGGIWPTVLVDLSCEEDFHWLFPSQNTPFELLIEFREVGFCTEYFSKRRFSKSEIVVSRVRKKTFALVARPLSSLWASRALTRLGNEAFWNKKYSNLGDELLLGPRRGRR